MSYSNGKIYGIVSIQDIKNAIGASSGDLGTLCRSSAINKWARFKPVSYPKINAVRSSIINYYHLPIAVDLVFDSTTGLNLAQLTQFFSDPMAISDYDTYINVAYNQPTGGASSPYRLLDWSGYDHRAQPPVSFSWGDRFAVDNALACKLYIQQGGSDTDSITFTDIINELVTYQGFNTNKTYLCMSVNNPNGDPLWFFFSEETYGSRTTLGEWGVQTQNKGNFQTAITNYVNQNLTFVVFLVNDTNDNIDNNALEYGISATSMNNIKSQFKVCALSLEIINGLPTDRIERECKSSSASDITYILDMPFYAEGLGFYNYNGHDVHVIQISQLGEFFLDIPKSVYGSVEGGQVRLKMEIGNNEFVYPFTGSGDNRTEVSFQNPTTRQSYVISGWQTIRNMSKTDKGSYYRVYYFPSDNDYYFYSSNIKSTYGVPLNTNSINAYYDLNDRATGIENIDFSLYFRASSSSQEQYVSNVRLPYNIALRRGETPVPSQE